jgi:hypothetical protein
VFQNLREDRPWVTTLTWPYTDHRRARSRGVTRVYTGAPPLLAVHRSLAAGGPEG